MYQGGVSVIITVMPSGHRTDSPGAVSIAIGATLGLLVENISATARAARVERSMLSKMLSGRKEMSVDEFIAVCKAIGRRPNDVLELAGVVPEAPPPS